MQLIVTRLVYTLLVYIISLLPSYSQKINKNGLSGGIDIGVGAKNGSFHSSITYYELSQIAKNESFFIGWTGRLGVFQGKNVNYYTAPARLTRGRSGLGSIGKSLLTENIDTIYFNRTSHISLNFGLRAEYYVGPLTLGASIDLVGVTFGARHTGLISSSTGLFIGEDAAGLPINKPFLGEDANQTAIPNWLNLKLPGDLNQGMLTTEAYVRFRITEGVSLKAGYQWLTTEMAIKNKDIVSNNNRFRNRADFLYFGITAPISPW
ncbi:hypothetical protein GCM10028807_08190 [Spirosoma daeguense]